MGKNTSEKRYTSRGVLFNRKYVNAHLVLDPVTVVECNQMDGSYYDVKGSGYYPSIYDDEIDKCNTSAIGFIYTEEELIKKYGSVKEGEYKLQSEVFPYLYIQTYDTIDNSENVDENNYEEEFIDLTTTFKIDLEKNKLYKIAECKNGNVELLNEEFDLNLDNIKDTKKKTDKTEKKESKPSVKEEKKQDTNNNIDVVSMYKQITGSVKGQDKAVRQIVSTMDRNINLENYRNKTNMLIIGPSGSGKTEIFRSIASKLDIPMVVEDSEQYSATGYVGSDITDMLVDLYNRCGQDIEKTEHGIIVIDEIDKKVTNDNKDVSGTRVLNSLLSMMEGNKYSVNVSKSEYAPHYVTIDTSRITFVLLGAFSDLITTEKHIGIGVEHLTEKKYNEITMEDLKNYGLSSELLRRVSIYKLKELTIDDLVDIINNSDNSALKEYYHYAKVKKIKLYVNEKAIRKIAEKAILKKTGASGIKATLNEVLNDAFLEVSMNPGVYSSIKLTEESLKQEPPYILIKKRGSYQNNNKKRKKS